MGRFNGRSTVAAGNADDAKAAYQELAAAYEAQQEAIVEEPAVDGPIVEQPATL